MSKEDKHEPWSEPKYPTNSIGQNRNTNAHGHDEEEVFLGEILYDKSIDAETEYIPYPSEVVIPEEESINLDLEFEDSSFHLEQDEDEEEDENLICPQCFEYKLFHLFDNSTPQELRVAEINFPTLLINYINLHLTNHDYDLVKKIVSKLESIEG